MQMRRFIGKLHNINEGYKQQIRKLSAFENFWKNSRELRLIEVLNARGVAHSIIRKQKI